MRRATVALALLAGIALAPPARAGTSAQIFESVTAAQGLAIDPSIRSAAMGGASAAVFWGVDPNHWANPALLGTANGIRYEEGVTDYGIGARFLTQRTTLGYGGLGFAAAGQPFDAIGEVDLDFQNILGTGLNSSERIRSWAAGASLGGLSASLARMRGREAWAFTRHVDLALGYGESSVEEVISGGYPGPVASGRVVVKDWGMLARGAAPVRLGAAASGRLEGAYAFSAQNFADATFEDPFGGRTPVGQDFRNGVALHLALDPSADWDARLPVWLARGLMPLVSLGAALDAEHTTKGIVVPGGRDIERLGTELGLANVAFARWGRARYDDGTTVETWGYGVGLPLGRYGGYRYDHAVVPRPPDLPDLPRDGWTAWLDPVEVARAFRH